MARSIAGFLDADGVPRSVVESMLRSPYRPTRASESLWRSDGPDPITLGFSGMAATPASRHERQPFVDEKSGHVCVADIRLDNRDAVRAALGSPASAGDCELALEAYKRWGLSFARHLLGAFAIAIWDPSHRELVLCRDHVGVRSLIYTATKSRCIFGSAVEPVLRASPESHAARVERLQNMMVGLEEVEVDTTAFDDILRVPAASCVTWRFGSEPEVHPPYWVLQKQEQLQLGSDEEYGEALHDVFLEAVVCRLSATARPAVNLSGGLDSSAIAAVACAHQSEQLRTYSAIADRPKPWSDTPHIHTMISHLSVDPVLLTEADIARLHRIGPILDDPDGFFDVEQGLQGATANAMSERGEGVLLSGLGGDDFLDVPVLEIARRRLREHGLRPALSELVHRDGEAVNPAEWVRPLLKNALPIDLGRLLARSRRRSFRRQLINVGIDPDSTGGRRLEAAWESLCSDPLWTTPVARLNRGRRRYLTVALERYDRIAARHGIDVRHPFLDVRFIEFALSLPPEQLHRDGWTKWILRNGTMTELPSSIAWRPKSGGMSEFWDVVTASSRPPGNICAQSPDVRLFESRQKDPTTELTHEEFLRFIAKSWWLRHAG